jgi:Fe(3+) dicitrate transport protein
MPKRLLIPLLLVAASAGAQETLEEIQVTEEKEGSFSGYWQENKGTQIYSGKKNTVTDLKQIPKLQTNNYRQATSQTPGLLISEIPNESLAAITYRGLGDPHESYNVLLLQDGLPVAADMYGYPAHYYSPALPMMDKFQFIRGGACLLFGPQPGGVVNYLSRPLKKGQALSGHAGLTTGSYDLLSTNNAIYGSSGDHAYGAEYFRRQGNGPQRVNSDFAADYVQLRNHTFKGKNKYKLSFNGYNSDHGEPGGFAREDGPNANVFGDDLRRSSKRHDRLKVTRAQLAAGVEHRIDEDSELHVNVWAQAYERFSKRQRGGGFGTFPSGADAATNTINTQRYHGLAGEVRYRKNYRAFGNEHTFSGGVLTYNIDSPLHEERGARADANSGVTRRQMERTTRTNSLFAENRFAFGKFMVTPGVRVESIRQTIDERKNAGTGTTREDDRTDTVPLFGLGLAYHTSDDSQLYANVSEAYKPITFQEAVPLDASTEVSEDIDPSKILNYELGYRGQTTALNWDVSAFLIRYENKFGQLGTNTGVRFANTGAGTHKGVDAATELKLANFLQALRPYGNFNLYANVAFLDARYTRGSLEGKTPMYAPKTLSRVGLIHGREARYRVALMGVMVGRHFGTDDNSDARELMSYTVFDLTADVNLSKAWLLSAGINNLFDREYAARVRNDGFVWALDRNYYAGVTYQF